MSDEPSNIYLPPGGSAKVEHITQVNIPSTITVKHVIDISGAFQLLMIAALLCLSTVIVFGTVAAIIDMIESGA